MDYCFQPSITDVDRGTYDFDALGKEKTKLLTFTNDVNFFKETVYYLSVYLQRAVTLKNTIKSGSLKKSVFIEYR